MAKLALPSNKDFTDLTDLSICFVRVGAFSSAWTPTQRNPEPSNFRLGDFIEGIALAPSSKEYRFASLVCWKRASMSEWKAFNKASRFCPGQIQIDSNVFRSNYRHTFTLQCPLLSKCFLIPYLNYRFWDLRISRRIPIRRTTCSHVASSPLDWSAPFSNRDLERTVEFPASILWTKRLVFR